MCKVLVARTNTLTILSFPAEIHTTHTGTAKTKGGIFSPALLRRRPRVGTSGIGVPLVPTQLTFLGGTEDPALGFARRDSVTETKSKYRVSMNCKGRYEERQDSGAHFRAGFAGRELGSSLRSSLKLSHFRILVDSGAHTRISAYRSSSAGLQDRRPKAAQLAKAERPKPKASSYGL
jgi:hypothetical protein